MGLRQKLLSSGTIITISFALTILIGAVLLMMPFSSATGEWTPFLDALFTATSATCVTGLVVYDTVTHWSMIGQLIILILIQIGGMGVVTMALAVIIISGKKIGLKQRLVMQDSISAPQLGGVIKLTGFIVRGTILIELLGAMLLFTRFYPDFGLLKGIWYSVFHSVSAFCNAGFDLMGVNAPFSSLTVYSADWVVNITIMLLIIIGGIGFFVWHDIKDNGLKFKHYSLHTKLVLITTATLLILAFIYFYFVEFSRETWNDGSTNKFIAAAFQAVTPRTAGFNTVDLTLITEVSVFVTIILMLIGGSPGSTAGGFKTTTVASMFLCIRSIFENRSNIECFGRRLPVEILRRAVAVFLMYIMLFLLCGFTICLLDNVPLITALFESASAVGTVGLTLGITPYLCTVSHVFLIILMFFGRVGGLTMIFVFGAKMTPEVSRLPQESITIG